MLKRGDAAPDFSTTDCQGRPVSLSGLKGKKVVLFFFPKAFTPGCTIEIRNFRDHQAAIEARNATLIGVSLDKPARQCEFARSENIDFPLIGDESRAISESYGVIWPILRKDRRATFMINEEGLIDEVINHEVQVHRHLDDVLARLGVPAATS